LLEEQGALGDKSAKAVLARLKRISKGKKGDENLLAPLKYESGAAFRQDEEREEGDFGDPADRAVTELKPDHRKPIVDFAAVSMPELDALCDHFGAALNWATKDKPDLMVMGARWLVILRVMRPGLLRPGMWIAALKKREFELRGILLGRDPAMTGDFFRRPLAWVAGATSVAQLGQLGYSLIKNLRTYLVQGMTDAQLGSFKNDTRQAANKPMQDFRDTFSGIKSLNMRGEETRKKCRRAQM
jgi:hypothetical protein